MIPPLAGGPDPIVGGGSESRKRAEHQDVIEISDEAKHLNATKAGRSERVLRTDKMDPGASRVRPDISDRVHSGFYDSEEVVDRVAGRLLDLFGL